MLPSFPHMVSGRVIILASFGQDFVQIHSDWQHLCSPGLNWKKQTMTIHCLKMIYTRPCLILSGIPFTFLNRFSPLYTINTISSENPPLGLTKLPWWSLQFWDVLYTKSQSYCVWGRLTTETRYTHMTCIFMNTPWDERMCSCILFILSSPQSGLNTLELSVPS